MSVLLLVLESYGFEDDCWEEMSRGISVAILGDVISGMMIDIRAVEWAFDGFSTTSALLAPV